MQKDPINPHNYLRVEQNKLEGEVQSLIIIFALSTPLLIIGYSSLLHYSSEQRNFDLLAYGWYGLVLGFILKSSTIIKIHFLKKYLKILMSDSNEGALELGKKYYSIKRKRLAGLDGQSYTDNDIDQIEKDIDFYFAP